VKNLLLKSIALLKNVIFLIRPNLFLGFLRSPSLFFSNVLSLTKWISEQSKDGIFNDYFTFKRDYLKRYKLYENIVAKNNLSTEAIDYIEFGVSDGSSFKWWVNSNSNPNSKFYGFDTFEGLPEDWGFTYDKGEMSAPIPKINDLRAEFVKGLFQETVPDFITNHKLKSEKKKIIHCDADLFSSTLYALSMISPFIQVGDIILFDEFNVPNHEFLAYKIFTRTFYIKTKLIGAVNNYYQVAMVVTEVPKNSLNLFTLS